MQFKTITRLDRVFFNDTNFSNMASYKKMQNLRPKLLETTRKILSAPSHRQEWGYINQRVVAFF